MRQTPDFARDLPSVETHHVGRHTSERLVASVACPRLAAHQIALCGLTLAAVDYEFCRLKPDKSHVVASLDGHGLFWIDGRWVEVNKNAIYLLPLGVPHAFKVMPGKRWSLCWVSYRRLFTKLDRPRLYFADSRPLWSSIDGLHAEVSGANHSLVAGQWADLVDGQAERLLLGPRDDRPLDRLWRQVRAQPEFAWNLAILAKHAAMSPEHLRRVCLHEYGTSPMRYVTALRLRHALTLLAHAALDLDAVALMVGYASGFAFSATFKRWFGVAPSRIREQILAGKAVPDPLDAFA